jgi:hypothetical protein
VPKDLAVRTILSGAATDGYVLTATGVGNGTAAWESLPATALAHAILSAVHSDTTAAPLVRGDLLVATGASPLLTRYAWTAPAANLMNVFGGVFGDLEPTWKALLDATVPATLTVTTAATVAAHRDHVHPITSSANPGANESLLATDADGYLTLAKLTTTAQLVTANAELTVATKNKYLPYLQDAEGVYLRHQTYYWTGAAYAATEGYGLGYLALESNTGTNPTALGYAALQSNTGTTSTGVGYAALQNNTGAGAVGVGHTALQSNTGTSPTALGYAAGVSNSGHRMAAFGYRALGSNTGDNSAGVGYAVMRYNTGAYVCGLGESAAAYNAGTGVGAFGYAAAQYNTAADINGFGSRALEYNTGASTSGVGQLVGRYNNGAGINALGYQTAYWNNWPYVTAIGHQSTLYFLNNAATDQAFTDAEITADTITFGGAHGFGTTGAKVNLCFSTTAGTPPTGLVHNAVYQFTITSPTVMSKASIGVNASADFAGKLTNSVDIHNSIAIGYDANASKAHQVMLGGADIVETYLRGSVGINITPTAKLTLPAGSATQYTSPLKFTSGTLLTTPEAGAVEFLTDDFWATITTGAARKGVVLTDGTNLTSGRVPFATTNGRLVDDADLTFATDTLSATKVSASGGVTTQAVDFVASTPDALAGDVNNWDLGNNTFIRATGGAGDRIVTGIAARASGHLLIIQNIGTTNKLTFSNESASSSAANRLINGNAGSVEITPNHTIMYIYDATTARWREVTHLL